MSEFRKRYIREFLDMIVLSILKKRPMCGSDIIVFIRKNFKISFNAGRVYSLLHSLEKKRLVKRKSVGKKKIYTITKKGRAAVKKWEMLFKV